AEEVLITQLRRSVASHLVSDVPVGVFLSGGTDSSLVAALAVQEGQPLQAFSLGFEEAAYNELPYAEAVARHLGLPWEKEVLSAHRAASLLMEMPKWYDEPFGDVSALPTYLVSRLAARSVKVVLAGDGGDELFWGYGRYPWAKRIATWRPLLSLSAPVLTRLPSPRIQRVGKLLDLPAQAIPEHIFSQEQYAFSWAEIQQLHDDFREPWHSPYTLPEHPVARQSMWDFLHYLPDDLLTKVDRASMQHSLEVRVPLLDKAFVELAWQVAPALKYPTPGNPIQYKPLLRRVLRRFLPPAFVERRKWGFTIPLAQWLQSSLRDWLLTYTEPHYLQQQYGLHPQPIRKLHKAFVQRKTYLATRLWLLAVLGSFRS
ncbi:MAG: asparagine synthase C-terminal domain-containing protein, partial [Bacteroidia bacterium]|nr:asparagine synthase C-terminal domain-containing protein [Bacteroidia bacterium]MDW8235470.1 asparagine synthase C-terminal domain-containing protein [Bacteroidia bacterium]